MYFYQLVKGSMRNDGTNIGKIVVIDDPVSSMDSTALFIVSSLIREMVDITLNNYDLEYGSNAIQGFYIKQMFVLTHNHNT
jgi:wobble nucleotide-excising tRNase